MGEAAALSNEVLQRSAKKYDHTTAQVCLRWGIQQGILPLPKSVHKNRIEENTHIFDFELTDDEMDVIGSLRNLEKELTKLTHKQWYYEQAVAAGTETIFNGDCEYEYYRAHPDEQQTESEG